MGVTPVLPKGMKFRGDRRWQPTLILGKCIIICLRVTGRYIICVRHGKWQGVHTVSIEIPILLGMSIPILAPVA